MRHGSRCEIVREGNEISESYLKNSRNQASTSPQNQTTENASGFVGWEVVLFSRSNR